MEQQNIRVNPLLERIRMPGETFRLPSSALFYTGKNILSSKAEDGEVHILPMTTLDEIVMKSPDLLFSGDAVRQVFGRCIPDVIEPGKLLSKDVDFLLVALRKVSYGSDWEFDYKHFCPDAKNHSYVASIDDFIRKAKRIDPNKLNTDFCKTLANGQIVQLTPITFESYVKIMQASDEGRDSPEKIVASLVESMSSIILSVDGITDKELIKEWLSKLPLKLKNSILDSVDATLNWGPDFNVTIICKDCGQEVQVQAPMNPLTFFI